MTKDNREMVQIQVEADTSRLYGRIDEAIAYLEEMRVKYSEFEDFGLEEHWTGYEDMEMVFSYCRYETDEEMSARLEDEERARRVAEREAERKAQRERDLEEYRRLKSSLGL